MDDKIDQAPKRRTRLSAKRRPATDREERTLALRSAILESAIGEFAAKGFAGASLRAIASRTGIELGHLGYHFSTKLELWQAAVDAIFESFPRTDTMPLPRDSAEAALALTQIIMGYAAFCVSHPEHIQIVFGESPAGGERLEWIAQKYLNGVVHGIERQVRAAQQHGLLQDLPVNVFVAGMVGISAINFALPKLRDILLGGGISLEALVAGLSSLLRPSTPA